VRTSQLSRRAVVLTVALLVVVLGAAVAVGLRKVHDRHANASAPPVVTSPTTRAPVTAAVPPKADPTRRDCAKTPESCGYPGSTTTGVVAGTVLTDVPGKVKSGPGWIWNPGGWIAVTGNGAVVSGLRIAGHIEIMASNVVIQNDDINQSGENWGIALRSGSNVTIADNAIYSPAASGDQRLTVGIKDFGGSAGVRILRNDIYHTGTAVQIEQGLIQDNYIHDMALKEGDHINGITSNGGTTAALTITHNTILNSYDQTDAVGLFEDFGIQANRSIDNNLLAGGGYVIYGGANPGKEAPTNIKITNNRISTLYYPQGGSFGVLTATSLNGGGVISGNFLDDTGAALNG
jgi:hypothetical protein